MSEHDKIAERIVNRFLDRNDFPLQKFMNFKKYSDLITTSSLYTCRSDRFNDTKEACLFVEESILSLKNIEDNHNNLCTFLDYDEITDPVERITILLKSIFGFNHPRHMNIIGNRLVRPDHDDIHGYSGFDYKSAQKILEFDVDLLRINTYITCYCCNLSIKKHMIEDYGEIIIRTSKERLRQAIHIDASEMDYEAYPVVYFEENGKDFSSISFFQNAIYNYSLFGCKRVSYDKEEEFRIVVTRKSIIEETEDHISLKIDLEKLIEEIIVTNDSDLEKVKKLNETCGYSFKISCQYPIE